MVAKKIDQRSDWAAALEAVHQFIADPAQARTSIDERIVFYLQLAADCGLLAPGKHIVDLGAGICWLDPMMRKLGADVTIVDDFGGGGGVEQGNQAPALQLLERFQRELGIKIASQDFIADPLPLPDASVDGITCYHSVEHWHHSPKKLFAEIQRVLRPGGWLIIATPNAANIRKRIHVIFGANIWSPLNEWYYDDPVFRGHVREPIVRDLHRLCEWNHLEVEGTYGRNFIGRESHVLSWLPRTLRHALANVSQAVLQYVPTLCSDIHVVARKQ